MRTEVDAAYERMLDPIAGSPATGKTVAGIVNIFVDGLFGTGGTEMEQRVLARLRKDFQVGSEDWNDVTFTGQRIRWIKESLKGRCIEVGQQNAIDELEEIPAEYTVFLPESRERTTKDEMSYGSLIDFESRRIKRSVLSTSVGELYYLMQRCGSCQFLRGLWMDFYLVKLQTFT